ncbi:hypothetical protein J7L48_01280 [bacterium]|nr:hypothetical protein [bacterium]
MIDKRIEDIEAINRIKRTQVIFWILFFVIILVGLILVGEQMSKIGTASRSISTINGVKIMNKYGEVIKEHKNPRFKVDEEGNTIDLLKYWEKQWYLHIVLALLIALIAILLLVFIIKEIRYFNKLELEKLFKYELDKSKD